MNILYFSPSNGIGGAELSLLDILKEANIHGHNCFVALPPPKRNVLTYMDMLRPYSKAIFIIRPMSWHIYHTMNWKQRIISYLYQAYVSGWHLVPVFRLYKIIKKYKIDLVHSNTIWGIDAMISAKLSHKPHVWNIRESIGDHPDAFVKLPLQRYPKLFERIMDKLSAKIIVNSNYTASFCKPYFPCNKLEVIYNSLPDNWFVQKVYQDSKPEFIIGTVANVTSKLKNHQFVILVANSLKKYFIKNKVRFHIYGSLPEDNDDYYRNLLDQIDKSGLGEIVRFEGYVESSEIFSEIDILFHPFGREGFGRIFIEAMGKGIPVVAVKGGGANELIEDGITGYKVDDKEPENAAEKIAKLIQTPSDYKRISTNSYEFASSNFRSANMWRKIEACYKDVVKFDNLASKKRRGV